MNDIDLRRFDLNLLVVFDVLMAERSVTRAAERLGRTQSAVSHSLARLRTQLGDPLLLKGARRMEPTPFATAFIEQAQPILRDIQRVLASRRRFEPAGSQRVFRIGAPDFVLGLFTELLGRCAPRRPACRSNGRRRARPCCSRSPRAGSTPPSPRLACACPPASPPSRSARCAGAASPAAAIPPSPAGAPAAGRAGRTSWCASATGWRAR